LWLARVVSGVRCHQVKISSLDFRHGDRLQPGCYNNLVQRKVFWTTFAVAGLIADMALPFWWALLATVPIGIASWWIAYRSDWF
jgi:hypothetical protein